MTIVERLKNLLRRAAPAPVSAPAPAAAPLPVPERWDAQFAGTTAASWLAARNAGGRLYADITAAQLAVLQARFPGYVTRTRDAADRACRHEFDLLGSGWCTPADPDRASTAGYRPIDWVADPIARLRFPAGFKHADWKPDMRPGLADIKWPWEIGRCQHWVALGQAYRLTGDERYAQEVVHQHQDFLQANPVGMGVQFVCTMDVAIRAFNWALAFELIRESAAFDAAATERAYRSLFDLGVFIVGNLENKYEVTSNHFLSNVAGVYGIALIFKDLPAGRRWLAQGREWFEQEMKVQVLPDGMDYESSIPYHRLVTELFLSGARIAALEGTPLSAGYLSRLRQMVEFQVAVQRPDGLMPQVGDADDGRLHIFTNYGTWQPQDARHLTGPGAMFFAEPGWVASGGDDALWEAAWWGFDLPAGPLPPAPESLARLFQAAGIAVARNPEAYLLVTNSRVGTNGFGNHKHNDLLSFEYHVSGTPLVVDPGSYVYTSNPDARNLFRATAYHNTLQADGVEQNDIRLDYLFRMFETSSVEHQQFVDGADAVEYRGQHTGYERLPAPLTHERGFRLQKATGALTVTDRLIGSGRHSLRWHFHFAPGVTVTAAAKGTFHLATARGEWWLAASERMTAAIADAWYSPSYGVRVACQAIDLTLDVDLSGSDQYEFAFTRTPKDSRQA